MGKRIIGIGMLMLLLLSLAACGGKEEAKDVGKSEQAIAEKTEAEKTEASGIIEDDNAGAESGAASEGKDEENVPSDEFYLEEIDREKYPYLLSWKGEEDGKLLSRYYFFREDLSVVYKVSIDRNRVSDGQGFSYETSAEKLTMKVAEEKRDSVMELICDASGTPAAETVSNAEKDPMDNIF